MQNKFVIKYKLVIKQLVVYFILLIISLILSETKYNLYSIFTISYFVFLWNLMFLILKNSIFGTKHFMGVVAYTENIKVLRIFNATKLIITTEKCNLDFVLFTQNKFPIGGIVLFKTKPRIGKLISVETIDSEQYYALSKLHMVDNGEILLTRNTRLRT